MTTEQTLNELTEMRDRLITRLNALSKSEDRVINKELLPSLKKQFVGKYFRFSNSFGGATKSWYLYIKVLDVTHVSRRNNGTLSIELKCIRFQKNCNGTITIDTESREYSHNLYQEITETTFNKAWDKIITDINKL